MVITRKPARTFRPVAVFATLAIFAAACGGGKEALKPGELDPDTVLRYAYDLESGITNLDPAISTNTCDKNIWSFIYDTLLRSDGNGNVLPHVATEWELAQDAKTLSLTLRDDVKYHDGTALTAQTVQQGIEYLQSNTNLTDIAMIESFETPDATHIVMHLKDARAQSLLFALAGQDGMLVAPSAFGKAAEKPAGAGPFTFQSFERGQSLVVIRNPNYWDAEHWKLEAIQFVQAAFGPPAVQRFQANEADVAKFLGDSYEVASKLPNAEIATALSGEYAQLEFRLTSVARGDTPFAKLGVRQAINHAIDREKINEVIENGLGEVTWQHFNSDSPFHLDDLDNAYPYDPEKAKQLLAEAGYPDGFEFEMVIPGGVQNMENQGLIVQEQLAEVGIKATIVRSLPTNIAVEYYIQKVGEMFSARELATIFAPSMLSNWATGEFVAIHDGAENAEMTRIRDAAYAATGEEMADLLAEGERYASANALDVPIYHAPQYMVWNAQRVGGTPVTPADACTPIGLRDVYIKSGK